MQTNWELIIDVARGLASDSELTASERELVKLFSLVNESSLDPVPELWALRAKALVVRPPEHPVLFGRLLPQMLSPSPGYRSDHVAARNLTFEFPTFEVVVRIEAAEKVGRRLVFGVVKPYPRPEMRIGTASAWVGPCDEDGYFELELGPNDQAIRLQSADLTVYQLDLP